MQTWSENQTQDMKLTGLVCRPLQQQTDHHPACLNLGVEYLKAFIYCSHYHTF